MYAQRVSDNTNFARWTLNNSFMDQNTADMAEIYTMIDEWDKTFTRPDTRAQVATLKKHYADYQTVINEIEGYVRTVTASMAERDKMGTSITEEVAAVSSYAVEKTTNDSASLYTLASQANTSILVVMIVFLALGAFIIFFIKTRVVAKLHEFVDIVAEFTQGDGDLTKRVPVTSKDEIGELAVNFNQFVENVHTIIKEVKYAAEEVASGNNELASTMEELSSTFGMQSEQISSVAGNVDTINDSSIITAQALSESMVKMTDANDSVKGGSKQLNMISKSMGEIKDKTGKLSITITNLSDSSGKIGEILDVISDIADQTNLLALNAAI
jgi:methyl-accepting chemotaxis protein